MEQFKELKRGTPVYGAILVNKSLCKVLLVQLMTTKSEGGPWTFPKGKLEQRDQGDPFTCAAREVSTPGIV
jgi:8-oxo-dGTP pyrophosphatase MutT (NUDIX family)